MANFYKKFETKHTIYEMKTFINTKLLSNQALKSFINSTTWNENILNISSTLGDGKIMLQDYLIEIEFELNFMGNLAKNTLESTLESEFKQLQSK